MLSLLLPHLLLQLFESLNVAMQAMAAAYLGKHDRSSARAVLVRTLQISSTLGVGLGLLLAVFSHQLVGLFTKDAAVAALACAIMPVIAFFMPLDAAASITDGGLIAAGQTNALSVIQVLGTLVQYGVMAVLIKGGMDSVVYVWAVLKVMTLARLGGGLFVHFRSRRSAFKPKGADPAQADGQAEGGQPAAAGDAAADAAGDAEVSPGDQAAAPAVSAAIGHAGGAASPAASRVSRQPSRSSVTSTDGGVLAGSVAGQPLLPQQQQPSGYDYQQLQALPPQQQHQVMMQHQQQQGHRQLPVGGVGGGVDQGKV
jgi:hypothetical protein